MEQTLEIRVSTCDGGSVERQKSKLFFFFSFFEERQTQAVTDSLRRGRYIMFWVEERRQRGGGELATHRRNKYTHKNGLGLVECRAE